MSSNDPSTIVAKESMAERILARAEGKLVTTMILTPKRQHLTLSTDGNDRQSDLSKVIAARIKGRVSPVLTKHDDLEFFLGFASAYPFRYGSDLVAMLRDSDSVHVSYLDTEKK